MPESVSWTEYSRERSLAPGWPGKGYKTVDLHRNLSQKWPFPAAKIDPATATWTFEKVTICFALDGSLPNCKSRINPACNSTASVHFVLIHVAFLVWAISQAI